jgi:hypothetical protein
MLPPGYCFQIQTPESFGSRRRRRLEPLDSTMTDSQRLSGIVCTESVIDTGKTILPKKVRFSTFGRLDGVTATDTQRLSGIINPDTVLDLDEIVRQEIATVPDSIKRRRFVHAVADSRDLREIDIDAAMELGWGGTISM